MNSQAALLLAPLAPEDGLLVKPGCNQPAWLPSADNAVHQTYASAQLTTLPTNASCSQCLKPNTMHLCCAALNWASVTIFSACSFRPSILQERQGSSKVWEAAARQATGQGVMKILNDMAANFFYTLQIRDRITKNPLPLSLPGLLINHSSWKTPAPHTHRHMPLEPFPAVRQKSVPSGATDCHPLPTPSKHSRPGPHQL